MLARKFGWVCLLVLMTGGCTDGWIRTPVLLDIIEAAAGPDEINVEVTTSQPSPPPTPAVVVPPPPPAVALTVGGIQLPPGGTTIILGGSIELKSGPVSGNVGPVSFQWWVNGVLVPGALGQTFVFVPAGAGVFTIVVVVTDASDNQAQQQVIIVVLHNPPPPPPVIVYTITAKILKPLQDLTFKVGDHVKLEAWSSGGAGDTEFHWISYGVMRILGTTVWDNEIWTANPTIEVEFRDPTPGQFPVDHFMEAVDKEGNKSALQTVRIRVIP
ncbi:MAG: hypothetical protein HYT48_02385 [Candidatus Vogelbacteria bacterium]|nr:hypothetical protein [Candidatus Vogelbacteria bacterium]